MESFFSTLSRIGPMRLVAMLGITAGVTIALMMMAANMGKAEKTLLYSNLDLKEAGQISSELDRLGIGHDVRAGGSSIFVDRKKLQAARLALAEENLPSSGSVGYELFDRSSSMGQTVFTQNLNKKRALEGELTRSIMEINGVAAARVLLVLPERQLFETQRDTAKASVTIKLRGSGLGAREVNAIQHLVAGAVAGLKASAVTVVDDNGRLLAGGLDDTGDEAVNAGSQRQELEDSLRQKIMHVLASVVGQDSVAVQVHADVDLNRITEHETKYDPDGQVLISSDTSEQTASEKDKSQSQAVSVSENIPNGGGDSATEPGSSSENSTTRQTKNFGVSKTETTKIVPPGAIERLSVAVNVDGVRGLDAEGKPTWTARSPEEMAQITALVKSAMGYDAARKDQVEVTNLRFSRPAPLSGDVKPAGPSFNKDDIMRLSELGILGIVSIVMIFFLGRPLIAAIFGGGVGPVRGAAPAMAAAGMGAMPQLPGAGGGMDAAMALPAPDGGDMSQERGIDVSKIEGQVKASSVKQVANIVDKHPDESVAILRNWLHGD